MRPETLPNAADKAVEVLAGIEEADLPNLDLSDVPDGPPEDLDIVAAPEFPSLELPAEAAADVVLPPVDLPDVFDIA